MADSRVNEKQYRTLFNNIRDALVVTDTNRRIIDCNQAFEEMFGYSHEEILDRQTNCIYESREQFRQMGEAIEKNSTERGFLYIVDYKRKDGSVFPGETNVFYLRDEKGNTAGFVGQIRDITHRLQAEQALRNSEERFRAIVEKAPDPIFIQTDMRFAFVNPAALKLFGATDEKDLLGMPVIERFHPDFRDEILNRINTLNKERKPVEKLIEQKYIRLDGTEVWVETTGQPIVYNSRKGALVFVRDISERKNAEKEKEKLHNQLAQAQRLESIGRMAGGVAHDFNNLLSIILGYSEMVLEDVHKDHPHNSQIKEIHDAALRARELTRQLLAFSRKQVLEIQPVDINAVVTGFERLLRRMLGEDIELNLSLDKTPLTASVDTSQLEQVIMNLAVNARDAMPEGGSLTIETAGVDIDEEDSGQRPGVSPGRYAMISVTDTGCGMDADIMASIFEPFFTTKDKEKGTGLGLATSYGIVRQHGGSIWVYSEPGVGTTFKIYLPLDSAASAPEPRAFEKRPAEAGSATILVVEDDPAVRRLTVGILKREGYSVIDSESPQDAVDKASRHTGALSLVIADVIMPGMKGPEVYKAIHANHPEADVLYMSGYTDNVVSREQLVENAAHFIQKPFTANGLLEKVGRTLHKSAT
ncbi:MAG: PAS domain S-box protein [Thermodesulfobacteriota bacterium]